LRQGRPSYEGQAVHFERLPAREPQYREPATPLSAPVRRALEARGIGRLFEHQAQASCCFHSQMLVKTLNRCCCEPSLRGASAACLSITRKRRFQSELLFPAAP